jgi:hypothetical protein
MKKEKLLIIFGLFFSLFYINLVSSTITFNNGFWSTTFNCSEYEGGYGSPSPNCDGLEALTSGSYPITQITSAANYLLGDGSRGLRYWVYDGSNINSDTFGYRFSTPQKELWIRFYVRYQQGFNWSELSDSKWIYLYTQNDGSQYTNAVCEWAFADSVRIWQVQGNSIKPSVNGYGWTSMFSEGLNNTSNGQWHYFEFHLKMDTNQRDGVGEIWVDGIKVGNDTTVNYSAGSVNRQQGWTFLQINCNQKVASNAEGIGSPAYVDYDNFAISTTGYIGLIISPPVCGDGICNSTAGENCSSCESDCGKCQTSSQTQIIFFFEPFETATYIYPWYDATTIETSTTEHLPGSTRSAQFHFIQGAQTPSGIPTGSLRRKFNESDSIYVSYYVKHSTNWIGSNLPYHPHELLILTNKEGDYAGLARSHLTSYIEENEGVPRLALQDSLNIDLNHLNENRCSYENRGVHGCNGNCDGHGVGSCYQWCDGTSAWCNGHEFDASQIYFSDSVGQYYKGDWHHVEAYFKLNTILGGIGQANGILQYWYDNQLVINHTDVIIRTNSNSDMKFNQFLIGPWIGAGSPVDQTFWIDNLTVADIPPGYTNPINPPVLNVTTMQKLLNSFGNFKSGGSLSNYILKIKEFILG